MKFLLGLICGVLMGVIVATTWPTFAQLAPADATLSERLHWSQVDHTLRMQRDLERREHDRADPCRR